MDGETKTDPITLKGLQRISASGDLRVEDLQSAHGSIETELKNHLGIEEELRHTLAVLEQKHRVAGLPCSLHREFHPLLKEESFDADLHLKGKGQFATAFTDYQPAVVVSSAVIAIFALIITVLGFLVWTAAIGEGISLVEYFTRAAAVARLVLQGASRRDLAKMALKPTAYKV